MCPTDKRVLFVEDDMHFREYIEDVVAPKFDVDVVCCERSSQADKRLEEEPFDAAILDVRVTNGNGVSLYKKIMQRWPSLQVIFLTGYDSTHLREEIEHIGPARIYSKDSMMKPMFFESLMAQIGVQRRSVA